MTRELHRNLTGNIVWALKSKKTSSPEHIRKEKEYNLQQILKYEDSWCHIEKTEHYFNPKLYGPCPGIQKYGMQLFTEGKRLPVSPTRPTF